RRLLSPPVAAPHRLCPLPALTVPLEAHREVMLLRRALAGEVCRGRWLALGGGGYALIDVVPRSWAQLIAVATGEPLDPDAPLPAAFLESAARARIEHGLSPEPGILTYGDGRPVEARDWSSGFDPENDLDRVVQAARSAALPEPGLDPFLD